MKVALTSVVPSLRTDFALMFLACAKERLKRWGWGWGGWLEETEGRWEGLL